MTRARRASRPRFRLLPTVLLTLAILRVPTVVYAWGRSSSSFDIAHVRVAGTHLVPEKRALRLLRQRLRRPQPLHGDRRRRAQDARAALASSPARPSTATSRTRCAVTITEYEPAAYALAGDRWYVVDDDGYVICTAAEAAEQLAPGSRPTTPSASPTRELRRRPRRPLAAAAAPDARARPPATADRAGRLRPRAR